VEGIRSLFLKRRLKMNVTEFIRLIKLLPSDNIINDPNVWYQTQKEHWLGWLNEYKGPGAYGRSGTHDDAKFIYNHIVEPKMLLWLIEATKVNLSSIQALKDAYSTGNTMMQKSGQIRKLVPWTEIHKALLSKLGSENK
jgi:hypothetical protein